jgi:hypothetical protein
MNTTTIVLAVIAGVLIVLYMLRRKARLSRDED